MAQPKKQPLKRAEISPLQQPDLSWVFSEVPVGLMVVDGAAPDFPVLLSNEFMATLLGIKKEDMLLKSLSDFSESTLLKIILKQCILSQEKNQFCKFDIKTEKDEPKIYCGKVLPAPGTHNHLLITLEQKKESTKESAQSDQPLSLITSSVQFDFQKTLEKVLYNAKDTSLSNIGVIMISVDRLQLINETLGKDTGKALLKTVSGRIKKVLREGDTLTYLDSDRFVAIIHAVEQQRDLEMVAGRVHQAMKPPLTLGKSEFYSSVSLGIASSLSGNTDSQALIRDADFAVRKARKYGRGATEVYKPSEHMDAQFQFLLEIDLRHALEKQQFCLYYQPVVDMERGRIVGVEALIRWQHPEKGLVEPTEFIPIAEESGLIVEVGRWALSEAAKDCQSWLEDGLVDQDFHIAVNISNAQFHRTNVANDTEKALKEHGLPASNMVIELTESAIMEHPAEAAIALDELKKIGVKLALDDFGTGYSSLSALQSFPLNTVKIDRTFTSKLDNNPENHRVIQMITVLGHTLGLDIIAEGIEDKEQMEIALQMGCLRGQGYLFSRPLSEKDWRVFCKKPFRLPF